MDFWCRVRIQVNVSSGFALKLKFTTPTLCAKVSYWYQSRVASPDRKCQDIDKRLARIWSGYARLYWYMKLQLVTSHTRPHCLAMRWDTFVLPLFHGFATPLSHSFFTTLVHHWSYYPLPMITLILLLHLLGTPLSLYYM